MASITKTGYSITMGGAYGQPNVATWRTTLTATGATQREAVGMVRQEGANSYIYAFCGTGGAAAYGIMQLTTALTDTNGLIAPVTFTALGATANNALPRAVSIQTMNTGGTYGWFFIQGIMTCQAGTDSAITFKIPVVVSTASANCWAAGGGTTGVGIALEGANSAGAALCYVDLFYGPNPG